MKDGEASGCLGADTVVALVEDRADAATRARALAHASRCAACRELLSDLARGATAPALPTPEDASAADTLPGRRGDATLVAGARLGRYVLGEVLGAGGMGVVFAARDPELERAIAI